MEKAEILEEFFETGVSRIYTMKLCHGLNSRIYLSVGGLEFLEDWKPSDFLDISFLLFKLGLFSNDFSFRKINIPFNEFLLEKKYDRIRYQKNSIQYLKSNLFKTQNEKDNRDLLIALYKHQIKNQTKALKILKSKKKDLKEKYTKNFATLDYIKNINENPIKYKSNLIFQNSIKKK